MSHLWHQHVLSLLDRIPITSIKFQLVIEVHGPGIDIWHETQFRGTIDMVHAEHDIDMFWRSSAVGAVLTGQVELVLTHAKHFARIVFRALNLDVVFDGLVGVGPSAGGCVAIGREEASKSACAVDESKVGVRTFKVLEGLRDVIVASDAGPLVLREGFAEQLAKHLVGLLN